ncbi:FAD-linked oxidoreductase [Rhypophila decipiens]|uniref:FAD-linked oxidoreductase n=1 Tax=Rhypophila decipiens TaxID=261697 RepID=A0AAN7B6N9_9PEZI|nr:FAD-linked oxidoreductase [Rhypophila decipiens]
MKLPNRTLLLLSSPLVVRGTPVPAADGDILLSQLNQTLEGRVQTTQPILSPCFSDSSSSACNSLKHSLSSPFYRADQYPSFQNLQGEACISDPSNQCSLPGQSNSSVCNQGVLAQHYLEITSASDVQAVFDSSIKNKPIISIKNTGHDYNMRSSSRRKMQGQEDQVEIALWTRNLKSMVYHPSFVPSGCVRGSVPAVKGITLGAGVSTSEAMAFAHSHNLSLPMGASNPSVGIAGGWLLNGGHGVLTNGYGLAVDRVLEFKIVTPDSSVRVLNACQERDLFWALRGGGGGSFGVVLEATMLVEDDSGPVVSAMMMFPLGSDPQLREWVGILAEHATEWALAGWGGPSGANLSLLVNPFLGETGVEEARKMLAPAIEFVEKQTGGFAMVDSYPSWYEYWVNNINATADGPGQDGRSVATFTTSRIIPERVFEQTEARRDLVDLLVELTGGASDLGKGMVTYFLADVPLRYSKLGEGTGRSNETSIHPAWYNSVWHVVSYGGFPASAGLEERRKVVSGMSDITTRLASVAPDGCTYSNEADPWMKDWSTQFWGDENYKKLVAVKREVDPQNLLTCWHCVGWTPEEDGYECISGLA